MQSPSALGITPAQLYARTRSPKAAFEKLDPAGSGVVSLEDARKALKSLGVHMNLTEAKALAVQQLNGDRGAPTASLTLNYPDFLAAAGATQGRGEVAVLPPRGPSEGTSMPSSSRDVAANIAARLLQERGIGGEGYRASLAEAPVASLRPVPGRRASQLDSTGGLLSHLSEDASAPTPRSIKSIHATGEFTSAGIGAFLDDVGATHSSRKPDALQHGALDAGGIGSYVTQPARSSSEDGQHFGRQSSLQQQQQAASSHPPTPLPAAGRIADSGSLTAYLASEHSTALLAPVAKNTAHLSGGEFNSMGLAGFLNSAAAGGVPEGFIQHAGREPRRAFNDTLYTSSAMSGLASSRGIEAAAAAAAVGEVPILEAGGAGSSSSGGGGGGGGSGGGFAASQFAAAAGEAAVLPEEAGAPPSLTAASLAAAARQSALGQRERTGALSSTHHGLGGFVSTGTVLPATSKAGNSFGAASVLGQLSASGGLGVFQSHRPSAGAGAAAAAGEAAPLPTPAAQAQAQTLNDRHIPGPPCTLDTDGGLAGFLNSSDAALPPSLLRSIAMGHPPRSAVAHVEPWSALSAAGGLGHFNSSAEAEAELAAQAQARAARAAAVGGGGSAAAAAGLAGRLTESGGLAEYLSAPPSAPPGGALYTINPANPKEFYVPHRAPAHSGNTAALDVVGGVGGFFTAPHMPGLDAPPSHRGESQPLHSLAGVLPLGSARQPGVSRQAGAQRSALEELALAALDLAPLETQQQQKQQQAQQQQQVQRSHRVVSPVAPAPAAHSAEAEAEAEAEAPPQTPSGGHQQQQRPGASLALSFLDTPRAEPPTPVAAAQAASTLAGLSLDSSSSQLLVPPTPSTAAAGAQGLDLRRLARVRKAIRDVLPKKAASAAAVLRSRLHNEDGDGDGIVSDIEMLRGLYSITPGLLPSDCAFLIKYLALRFPSGSSSSGSGSSAQALSSTSKGLVQGISTAEVAGWFTAQPGGVARPGEEEGEEEAGGGGSKEDRLGRAAQRFAQFRAGWEEKHGAAARKEMAMDAAVKPEGPTWTRAQPTPFRVLRLVAGAPATPSAE